jgi:protein TonB
MRPASNDFSSAVLLSGAVHLAAAVLLPSLLGTAQAARPPIGPADALVDVEVGEPAVDEPVTARALGPTTTAATSAVGGPAARGPVAPAQTPRPAGGGPAAAQEVLAAPGSDGDVYPADAEPAREARSGFVASGANGDGTSARAGVAAPTPPPAPDPAALERARREARARYVGLLQQRISRVQHYPPALQRLGLEGVVQVSFRLDAAGSATGLVARSSAPSALERAALDAVRGASPFPPLPPELGAWLSVQVPIAFVLRR